MNVLIPNIKNVLTGERGGDNCPSYRFKRNYSIFVSETCIFLAWVILQLFAEISYLIIINFPSRLKFTFSRVRIWNFSLPTRKISSLFQIASWKLFESKFYLNFVFLHYLTFFFFFFFFLNKKNFLIKIFWL